MVRKRFSHFGISLVNQNQLPNPRLLPPLYLGKIDRIADNSGELMEKEKTRTKLVRVFERVTGFEPVMQLWESYVLPLHHTRNMMYSEV